MNKRTWINRYNRSKFPSYNLFPVCASYTIFHFMVLFWYVFYVYANYIFLFFSFFFINHMNIIYVITPPLLINITVYVVLVLGKGLWFLAPLSTIFSYIMEVSFTSRRNPRKTTVLSYFTSTPYHIFLYRVHLA